MNPRWKIRRNRFWLEPDHKWFVYRSDIIVATFNVWENALLYIDIQEAGA